MSYPTTDSVTRRTLADQRVLALAGLLLVALNLRPALTSVAPVLTRIGASLGFGTVGESVLSALPVICLGLAAPLAPRMARQMGTERAVFVALVVLTLALVVRPYSGEAGLFLGTAFAGGAIGVMGVLLPGLVKRDFPARVGLMTGFYTVALIVGAAIAAGATEPLRLVFAGDWRPALTVWLVPAVAAGLVWRRTQRGARLPRAPARKPRTLRRDLLAWQVTMFMGLQSSLAYIVFAWLPTILSDRGMAPVAAGIALSACILSGIATTLLAPIVGARMRDQRAVIIAAMVITLVGFIGCFYAPLSGIWLWVAILGLGQGGSFSIALALLVLRAPDPETADELSAMAQGVGYVLAGCGPLIVGLIHQSFSSWSVTGVFVIIITLAALAAGLAAGRDRLIAR